MTVVYKAVSADPDDPKEPLHLYHADLQPLVDCDLIGLTGQGESIKTVVLSDQCDVSRLEDYLNTSLNIVS